MAKGLPPRLDLERFRQRFPWRGADLQTLRDSLRPQRLPAAARAPGLSTRVELPAGRPPGLPRAGAADRLLGVLDQPLPAGSQPVGLAVVLHGLGGSSEHQGPQRLALALRCTGLAVLRLNLRGAGAGRRLAAGTYAADSTIDLLPALQWARRLAAGRPLLGVGLSLGGTQLLNAALAAPQLVDGIGCVSSPLDLSACARRIEARRNALYQHWLLRRLVAQTLADPFGLDPREHRCLRAGGGPRTIRAFDQAITAPRWGYHSLAHYYAAASPLPRLLDRGQRASLPATLLLHAHDDPWVPAAATAELARVVDGERLQVLLTPQGGHNGFHGIGDAVAHGCWSDRLMARWLRRLVEP